MPIQHMDTVGLSLYVMFADAGATAVDMTEGAGNLAGIYTASDAAIDAAGLAVGTYNARILAGTAAAKNPANVRHGVVARFVFDGTVETDQIQAIFNNLSVATISTVHVAPERTWTFAKTNRTARADNVITVHSSDDNETLSMDFTNVLNDVTDLSALNTVDDTGSVLTYGSLSLSGNRLKAHFDITAGLTVGTDYVVEVAVTTTDGRNLTRTGTLKCRDS